MPSFYRESYAYLSYIDLQVAGTCREVICWKFARDNAFVDGSASAAIARFSLLIFIVVIFVFANRPERRKMTWADQP